MVEKLQSCLRDKAWARWTALLLVASMMFFAYMFVDVMSPLKSLLESSLKWNSGTFGTYAASEYILCVFGFLFFAGIILDKMGVRFTGILSASLMVVGAIVKFIAISDWFQATAFCSWLNSWWVDMPGTAKMAAFGFMIFGCGCEMGGTTVSKAIAKWFKGKEMALAMGLEMAIARLGVFAVMWIAPIISEKFAVGEQNSIIAPLAFCTVLLLIGLINFVIFSLMDKTLDKQTGEAEEATADEFHISDLGAIFRSKMFWLVALLCVLYYSAIFPFQRYAPNFLECTLGIDSAVAAQMFSVFPILAMCLTPFLGMFLDFKGKGATMLMIGAIIMVCCHLCFAFVLPLYPAKWFAITLILTLGVSFSLVPAALWPSVPKIIDEKILGSAYCLIFWVQNIGLCLVPMLIGKVLNATNPGVEAARAAASELIEKGELAKEVLYTVPEYLYDYTFPMIIFSSFGILAFIFSFFLKIEDKRKGYGLENPNKQ